MLKTGIRKYAAELDALRHIEQLPMRERARRAEPMAYIARLRQRDVLSREARSNSGERV